MVLNIYTHDGSGNEELAASLGYKSGAIKVLKGKPDLSPCPVYDGRSAIANEEAKRLGVDSISDGEYSPKDGMAYLLAMYVRYYRSSYNRAEFVK